MRFLRGLDLNLTVALDALLKTGNVTAAARQLHVSQPTMTASLNRLRVHFGDELLIRSGRSMVHTTFARTLVAPVEALLVQLESTLGGVVPFDPSTSSATFTLSSSDHHLRSFITQLAGYLESCAPRVGLRINIMSTPEVLLRESIDLAIAPASVISSQLKTELLMTDEHVCVAWAGAKAATGLGMEDFSALGHVAAHYGRAMGSEQRALDRLEIRRRVEITVPSPSMIAPALIGTQRISIVPRQLAQAQSAYLPIVILRVPFALPVLEISMGWHPSFDNAPHLCWFREVLRKVVLDATSVSESSASASRASSGLTKR